jgi:hypothetical protein
VSHFEKLNSTKESVSDSCQQLTIEEIEKKNELKKLAMPFVSSIVYETEDECRSRSVLVSTLPIQRSPGFVPELETILQLAQSSVNKIRLKKLNFASSAGRILMLTFQFLNNMTSPPIGTYDYSPDKRRIIPDDKHISKIGFRTILMSDSHTRLNGMTMYDGNDPIV